MTLLDETTIKIIMMVRKLQLKLISLRIFYISNRSFAQLRGSIPTLILNTLAFTE